MSVETITKTISTDGENPLQKFLNGRTGTFLVNDEDNSYIDLDDYVNEVDDEEFFGCDYSDFFMVPANSVTVESMRELMSDQESGSFMFKVALNSEYDIITGSGYFEDWFEYIEEEHQVLVFGSIADDINLMDVLSEEFREDITEGDPDGYVFTAEHSSVVETYDALIEKANLVFDTMGVKVEYDE